MEHFHSSASVFRRAWLPGVIIGIRFSGQETRFASIAAGSTRKNIGGPVSGLCSRLPRSDSNMLPGSRWS
jgi:hypothetical protein